MITRNRFLRLAFLASPLAQALTTYAAKTAQNKQSLKSDNQNDPPKVITVLGPVSPDALGTTLIHEHLLVDFSGYANYDPTRWNADEVVSRMLPLLRELKDAGCRTFVDCTPNFLGRDPKLLVKLSKLSGLHILTNTGYYGGSDEKYLPPQAFSESAQALADRWIKEATEGLDATMVLPGFMKISVNPGTLSPVSRKLSEAAAITHRATGLTIASHTGPAIAAFEQLDVLRVAGVSPSAFIWVHAQAASTQEHHQAAKAGCWVSLDGVGDDNVDRYVSMLSSMKEEKLLHRVLISHDAGWYEPGKSNGGDIRGFTTLFKKLLPALRSKQFSEHDIQQIMVRNPAEAFQVRVRIL